MGPKTTPSLISRGGIRYPPPLAGDEIETPWEMGLRLYFGLNCTLCGLEMIVLAQNDTEIMKTFHNHI